MSRGKVALVTGASSGFGQLTVRALAKSGFRVFGTSRKSMAGEEGVEMLELDVTRQDSIDACFAGVLSRAGRLDVLVNNAGMAHASLIEETPWDVARSVFETTFWGAVRVTAAVLPRMREQRSGRIINVSSLGGLVGAPGMGFYSASKHALEGYTETLHAELHQFNIRVSLIEPGFYKTRLYESRPRAANRLADYDAARAAVASGLIAAVERGGDPLEVANTIVSVALSEAPALRYRVGKDAKWNPRLKAWLPERWFMQGVRRYFRLDSVTSSAEPPGGQGS